MTKPKCKACHNKTYCASSNGEDAHARSKRKSQFDNETAQCSQSGRQEPYKAKLLQDTPFNKQKHCHTAHVAYKPAFME